MLPQAAPRSDPMPSLGTSLTPTAPHTPRERSHALAWRCNQHVPEAVG